MGGGGGGGGGGIHACMYDGAANMILDSGSIALSWSVGSCHKMILLICHHYGEEFLGVTTMAAESTEEEKFITPALVFPDIRTEWMTF